jgi:hypothetical protein
MSESPFILNSSPSTEHYDTHVANRWVSENRFLMAPQNTKKLPSFSEARDLLPDPTWGGHESTVACYWRAWELAFSNLKRPTAENNFAADYCDTAFNGNLFMWDSSFITFFGVYASRVFDFQNTLDTFYRKQHKDGFICREISETLGQDCFSRFDPSSTGPNVMAWTEWNYFQKTGNRQRLGLVFPPLVAYHQWLRKYRTWQDGSYWTTGWGSGMDNLPRVKEIDHVEWGNGHLTWVDATLQAILSARVLLQMAAVLGREDEVTELKEEVQQLTDFSNETLWSKRLEFYCDRFASGGLSPVKHIGAYWALLAGCVPVDSLSGFVAHLENPSEFNRNHRVPALSADDPDYSATGGYWCGGIWAPTNYMVLKGLEANGREDLAHAIAKNHLENVVKVFESEDIHWEGAEQFRQFFHLDHITFDDRHTLWENYAPDAIQPGSHSKPGYVGWTGLPPIAVLFEDVFGISQDAGSNRLTWHVRLMEEHGVRRYPFGSTGLLELRCQSRNSKLDRPTIEIHSNVQFTLELIWEGGTDIVIVEKEP